MLEERQPPEAAGDAGKIAAGRMAFCTAACSIEKLFPFFCIAGLEIFGLHGASAAGMRIHLGFLIVNKCDDRGHVRVREIKRRHSFVDAPRANHRADFVSVDVFLHKLGTRQVRPGFAAGSIATVAEGTLRGEERLPLLHLFCWRNLLRG